MARLALSYTGSVKLTTDLEIDDKPIDDFCRRWRVTELSVFGSAARDALRSDSDIDLLISFAADAPWSLFDIGQMRGELAEILGRSVDLVERSAVEESRNPFRKRAILRDARPIYSSG